MKKFVGWMVVSLFILILAACGSSESDTSGDEAASDQSLYDQIKEEGVLTIGTEGTYAPYTFHNDQDELTGYDVDVAREVAKRMGVEAEFKETKWDAMFAGLNSERFDMIANQVGIKPDREEKYNFSVPYTYTAAVLVTNKNNKEIGSFEDLEGKTSAQSLTSNYSEIAKSYGAEVESVEGFNPAMQLLANGRVDATVNDRLSVLDYLNQQGENVPVEIVDKEEDASETAMMFRENNPELVDAVNEALKSMKEDGTLKEISNKWFNEDVSVK
ncbi:amino acid ABC transporter substrate-binding protein [Halobacillus shinanisalinarum]|uniref:Amino acid ABC transporter substrate-binding protein n=1 Tax=Halobacillus shinanisalinarum TaxID=2932258 RepID=A0ABY4GYF0_9BACI|nr:amino acid ABC transporter substrate-binding protein [Halobacillus shinanisalinarum]UOQ92432.1 amino acid ABC transporter substrate-binding protein [Halobacillus shinanisalinarum]